MTTLTPSRIVSVDVLRAITMLLMIFVNDLWSLSDIPIWLEHVPAAADGMGLADVVFPAFLFIVGMSIPFAVASRKKKGDNPAMIARHIIIRSAALIVMGVFLVNGENINEDTTGFSRNIWYVCSCIAFILIWNTYPPSMNRNLMRALQTIGWIVLLALAWHYRGGDGESYFQTYWWGILGLIGWAYLVSSLMYLIVEGRLLGVILIWAVFNALCMLNHLHVLPGEGIFRALISPIGEGSMPALVTTGTILSLIYLRMRENNKTAQLILIVLAIAVALVLLGLITRPIWEISKIRATPSWVWICSGITMTMFVIIFWIADIRRQTDLFSIIRPGGTNTLMCYLLPYFAYAAFSAIEWELPGSITTGLLGLIKSLVFAFSVVILAGWLEKKQLQLKL